MTKQIEKKETKDWGDTPLLCKCAQTLKDFIEGKITIEEAKQLLDKHESHLQKEMLAASFKTGK